MTVTKKRSVKDWIISLVVLVAGIALMCSGSSDLLVLGAFLTVVGIILLLVLKSSYHFEGASAGYKRHTLEYSAALKQDVTDFLNGKTNRLPKAEGTGGLLVYVYENPSADPAGFAQVFEFSQYEYKPVGDVYKLERHQVDSLLHSAS